MIDILLFRAPLWLAGLILVLACILAREAGSMLYRRVTAGKTAKDEDNDAVSHIVGAILGLLAFTVGFTFSIALDRFDTRRTMVAEEATAIDTAYQRASLLDEPDRATLQATLREYAHTRVAPEGVKDDLVEAELRKDQALRQRLWDETRTAVLPFRQTDQASSLVEAINDALNVGVRREAAGRAHVPSRILDVMILSLLVTAGMLGYLLRDTKGTKRQASTILLILFVIMLVLIMDIDRPRDGSIRVPQRPLEELVARLDRDAARQPAIAPPPAAAQP
ncbi:DUF4239 domain-containing protein [Altererythrobacter sp. Root672]|uniref:bestrophin-like domain n=1 Tax=Altererythrobacter sp. Root672 TaxID=1736584 RepID=UPI0007016B79|nr:DUF4239 domain-containing protein [Altererythrobacter sp. Root672]KRA83938.1 hypothetical protein ASD76_08010 [Altererythrobacter sp. Root672]